MLFVCVGLALGLTGCGKAPAPKRAIPVAPREDGGSSGAGTGRRQEKGFVFPRDEGGKQLAEILPPRARIAPWREKHAEPKYPATPPALERPELWIPLDFQHDGLVRMPAAPAAKSPQPPLPPDEDPLLRYSSSVAPPRRQLLPAGPRVRLPALNLPPLGTALAEPVLDLTSLVDPTTLFSTTQALKTQPPARLDPVPFQRRNLPDPFTNSQAEQLGKVLPENTSPQSPGMNPARP